MKFAATVRVHAQVSLDIEADSVEEAVDKAMEEAELGKATDLEIGDPAGARLTPLGEDADGNEYSNDPIRQLQEDIRREKEQNERLFQLLITVLYKQPDHELFLAPKDFLNVPTNAEISQENREAGFLLSIKEPDNGEEPEGFYGTE